MYVIDMPENINIKIVASVQGSDDIPNIHGKATNRVVYLSMVFILIVYPAVIPHLGSVRSCYHVQALPQHGHAGDGDD